MKRIPNPLAGNILSTIVYYDALDYPMSEFEIWKHLIRTDYYSTSADSADIDLEDIIKELKANTLGAFIECKHGFYFLKERGLIVQQRIKNDKITANKFKRLRKIVLLLRYVPFVRMIGITGRMAMKNSHRRSDWDLLIVLKNKRIWTGRTLITLIVHLIGKRRHGRKIADRICLNYFITDESLEVITKDLFSASEYIFLFPVFGWKTYQRFQVKNEWIRSMKPSYHLSSICPMKTVKDSKISGLIREIGEKMLDWDFLEAFLKRVEKKKIMENPNTTKDGSLIHAYDEALVFLPNPHGPVVFEKFKRKISSLTS